MHLMKIVIGLTNILLHHGHCMSYTDKRAVYDALALCFTSLKEYEE